MANCLSLDSLLQGGCEPLALSLRPYYDSPSEASRHSTRER